MEILYVTSFTPVLYAATGKAMVRSFLASETEGTLLICHEGTFDEGLAYDTGRISTYDLDQSGFLKSWLHANRDIIPSALGGEAPACDCEGGDDWKGHRVECVFHYHNKNSSRFFRKFVSLEFALSTIRCDAIVWMDCDCLFTRQLRASVFEELLAQASVLYHKSPDRSVVESGVIAFRCDPPGRALLQGIIERYRSGAFRRDRRWDDGYQFTRAVAAHPDVARDLGTGAQGSETGHVLATSPLGAYIEHAKGTHSRSGLMA